MMVLHQNNIPDLKVGNHIIVTLQFSSSSLLSQTNEGNHFSINPLLCPCSRWLQKKINFALNNSNSFYQQNQLPF